MSDTFPVHLLREPPINWQEGLFQYLVPSQHDRMMVPYPVKLDMGKDYCRMERQEGRGLGDADRPM